MLKSSGAMALATMLSRLLGMVRVIVYARFMGDGPIASAFVYAFQIPNLFRRLLGEGALTAAFIPLFKHKEKTESEKEMWKTANAVVSALVIVAALVVGLVMLGISFALMFGEFDVHTSLMLELLRVVFPYMLLVCLAAVFMGMLNARGFFFIPAMGATLLNVVMIATVLFVAPKWGEDLGEQIFALAFGVLVAGIAQAAFQLPFLFRDGYRLKWVSPWNNDAVREVVKKMIPATIGVAAFQFNIIITQTLAFWIERSSGSKIVASFEYAVRLIELPQGVFGVSLATFLLPTLAGLAAEKDFPKFRDNLSRGMGYLFFVNAIAAAMLIVLAGPIVGLLFERGEFTSESTQRASFALICLAPSLLTYSAVNVMARAFYAMGDTKVPMQISAVCLGLNLVVLIPLIFAFPKGSQAGALGLANVMSSLVNVMLLSYALRRKMPKWKFVPLLKPLVVMIFTAGISGMVAWFIHEEWMNRLGAETIWLKIGEVFVPAILAFGFYWGITSMIGLREARDLLSLCRGHEVKD
ncbi:MAG: murein biosynthesis integral membrane protein MurJ [Verrucomicrobiota bacterium]|jgi:putative peptidoglycan lipid II flippase|nr:murein biosynthesis integral membrane protein MurJ [Verrucomicrobiota bacterium]